MAEPRDDAELERVLRVNQNGPPGPGEASPWDFIKGWSDEYVLRHVWPVVSRLLVDSDATMRARCLEYVSSLAPSGAPRAQRLVEVAEQHPDLFADQNVDGMSLRARLAYALSDVAGSKTESRLATALWKIAAGEPMGNGPARLIARFEPKWAAEHARRWDGAAMDAIRAATETVAALRRDDLIDYLSALRSLPETDRAELAVVVEGAIHRDDARAALAPKGYSLPAPRRAAPTAEECRRALGLG